MGKIIEKLIDKKWVVATHLDIKKGDIFKLVIDGVAAKEPKTGKFVHMATNKAIVSITGMISIPTFIRSHYIETIRRGFKLIDKDISEYEPLETQKHTKLFEIESLLDGGEHEF